MDSSHVGKQCKTKEKTFIYSIVYSTLFILSLQAGVAIPLSAHQFGKFLSKLYPIDHYFTTNTENKIESASFRDSDNLLKIGILLSFLVSTVLLAVLPITFSRENELDQLSWSFLTYTACKTQYCLNLIITLLCIF